MLRQVKDVQGTKEVFWTKEEFDEWVSGEDCQEVQELQENKDNAERLTLRQFRYIKFIDQRSKKDCLLKEYPYPKYYNGD
jgi:hypothetical protein